MKAQLNLKAIKDELVKLTDTEYLKKEVHRISQEIRNFDFKSLDDKLPPKAQARLKKLEVRFHDVKGRLNKLQEQVDTEVGKLMVILQKTRTQTKEKFKTAKGTVATKAKTRKVRKKTHAN